MTHGSLFTGIGGFDLAAEWMGWENIFQCEKEPYCQQLLKQNLPEPKLYEDIKTTDFTIHRGTIDVLTGGDPCQPSSIAGLKKGKKDERYLWPEFRRCIEECNPKYIVNENVIGTISNGILDEKISDLECLDYSWWPPIIIPARHFRFPHRRDRVWLIAHSQCEGLQGYSKERKNLWLNKESAFAKYSYENVSNEREQFTGYSKYIRSGDVDARKLDKLRIKSLGNAIVPQVAVQIFKAIQQYEDLYNS